MQLAVFVTPKAGRDGVFGWRDGADGSRELAVHVTAAPENGKATKAACKVLAAFFHVPKSSVVCVSGAKSRHKKFELPICPEQLDGI